ncbi:virulence-associated E family protein [Novosphingobium mathurense]|nr:virulence-associated E family protein [Novosphingobium mathurense]
MAEPTDNVFDLQAWKGKLQTSKQGVKKSITNLMLHLENLREFGDKIRWNELAYRAEWNGHPIEDSDLIAVRLILEAHQFEPNVGDVLPAVMAHAKRNPYHPVREYLTGLKWDGVDRIDRWLTDCMGADANDFTAIIGRKTLIAAVARAFKPGCKVDTVLILEGEQGIRKSSAIATLFGEEFTAESVNLFDQHNKMVMSMMGAWCVELAEFIAITRKDENTVKGLLSMKSDRVVLPYAKMASEHPRQCIFFGTINPSETGYFTDATGNRRYWPVFVRKADLDWIAKHRDQLWAEAVEAYRWNETWWLEGMAEEELAKTAVALREEYDAWDEILTDKLIFNSINRVTVTEALAALGMPSERMDKKAQNRVAKCLRRLGYTSKYGKDESRKSMRIFEREAR